jgi:hypothetical protein
MDLFPAGHRFFCSNRSNNNSSSRLRSSSGGVRAAAAPCRCHALRHAHGRRPALWHDLFCCVRDRPACGCGCSCRGCSGSVAGTKVWADGGAEGVGAEVVWHANASSSSIVRRRRYLCRGCLVADRDGGPRRCDQRTDDIVLPTGRHCAADGAATSRCGSRSRSAGMVAPVQVVVRRGVGGAGGWRGGQGRHS